MGWKIILLTCCLAIFASCEVQATTYTCYDGNVSSTYLDMFDSMSIPLGSDYVVFRSSQYDYRMFYGDLNYSDNKFTGTGTLVTISQNSDLGYNSYYTINESSDSNFILSCSNHVVYSSLGSYPSMYEQEYYFLCLLLLSIVIIIISSTVRHIFSFTLRFRNGGAST